MKYWVYMNGEVPGCYTPLELKALADFSEATLLCPAEGEILEKNWRRSGEFPDIAKILQERDELKAPSAPAQEIETPAADVNQLIDASSARLFSHITDLVKELESRSSERALAQSVQRQLAAALADLAARDRLVEKLSRDLGDKELSLAKALDVIRRLEGELRRLLPAAAAPAAATIPAPPPLPSAPLPQAEPAQDPPPEAPAAQNAVVDLLKRFLSKDLYS